MLEVIDRVKKLRGLGSVWGGGLSVLGDRWRGGLVHDGLVLDGLHVL